jgi:hypothetical protein
MTKTHEMYLALFGGVADGDGEGPRRQPDGCSHQGPHGRGVVEFKHSTGAEYPPPTQRICMSSHPEIKSCSSDLGPGY